MNLSTSPIIISWIGLFARPDDWAVFVAFCSLGDDTPRSFVWPSFLARRLSETLGTAIAQRFLCSDCGKSVEARQEINSGGSSSARRKNKTMRRYATAGRTARAASVTDSTNLWWFCWNLKHKTLFPIRQRSQKGSPASLLIGAKNQDWIRVALARTKTRPSQKVLATQNMDPFVQQATASCLIIHAAAPA